MTRQAYSFVGQFEPGPELEFCANRHYLLCASQGVLRLEADGQSWTLPPARAALIAAGHPIRVTIVQRVTSASVLFDPSSTPLPNASLSVFDLTPLARELTAECGRWGDSEEPLPKLGYTLFRALAEVVWSLAQQPGPTAMLTGKSEELRLAITLTRERLDEELRFEDIAASVSLAPRSLARRFEDELGMTWRAALRRMRVLRAVELLADGNLAVSVIAFAVGYGSLSAFNAAFRDLTGQTPTQYRRTFSP